MFTDTRRYILAPAAELSLVDFTEFEGSADTVVYNADSSKFILEYSGQSPSYSFTNTVEGPYTLAEIKSIQTNNPQDWPVENDFEDYPVDP